MLVTDGVTPCVIVSPVTFRETGSLVTQWYNDEGVDRDIRND